MAANDHLHVNQFKEGLTDGPNEIARVMGGLSVIMDNARPKHTARTIVLSTAVGAVLGMRAAGRHV